MNPSIIHNPKRITNKLEGNGRKYGDSPLFFEVLRGF